MLRLSDEPFEYYAEQQVHAKLTHDPVGYYGYIKEKLTRIANGQAQMEMPPKQIFSDPDSDGDFRVMPCVIRDGEHVLKTVKLVGTNALQERVPNQITVGKACVMHPSENFVSHIFEACLLSSARTGICAALGIDLLAQRRQRLTLIGAGRVGFYTVLYAAALGLADEITLVDQDDSRARACAVALQARYPEVAINVRSHNALGDTDVLVLATTSRTPLYGADDFQAGLIVSVGADTDCQRELDEHWAQAADIYVDTLDSARYGDLRAWLRAGLLEEAAMTDLFTLLRAGRGLQTDRPRIFVSTGTAMFDNLTMAYMLQDA